MKSPGHREHPKHKVVEVRLRDHMTVEVNGEPVADSQDVVKVEEDGYPARYYFPRADVQMNKLVRSDTTTECPFKGTAHYYGIRAGGRAFEDAVWTYEDPYEEHAGLKDRLAFHDGKLPQIMIRAR